MQSRSLTLLMSIAVALFSHSVFAVYHQTISVATDEGEPVQSATISLSIPGQDTMTVQDNGEGDDDDRVGFFKLSVADEAVGKKGTLKVTSGGETTTRTISIGEAAAVAIASSTVSKSTASRLEGGQFTIDISRTDGNADTSLRSGSYTGGGEHLELVQGSVGVDYRLPLADVRDAFWGVQGRIFVDRDDDEGLDLDIHPTLGNDTFIRSKEQLAAMIYAGMTVASFNEFNLALILGARATQSKITGVTDESGGGGIRNHFSDIERSLQPSVIVEVTGPRSKVLPSRWRAGIALDHSNDHSVNGVTSVVGPYHFETDAEWQIRTFLGLIY